jgi:ATP-dependent DNA helicase RecG
MWTKINTFTNAFIFSLTYDEDAIYRNISNRKKSSSEILVVLPFGKTKTVSILNRLVEKGLVKTIGKGKAKKYFL